MDSSRGGAATSVAPAESKASAGPRSLPAPAPTPARRPARRPARAPAPAATSTSAGASRNSRRLSPSPQPPEETTAEEQVLGWWLGERLAHQHQWQRPEPWRSPEARGSGGGGGGSGSMKGAGSPAGAGGRRGGGAVSGARAPPGRRAAGPNPKNMRSKSAPTLVAPAGARACGPFTCHGLHNCYLLDAVQPTARESSSLARLTALKKKASAPKPFIAGGSLGGAVTGSAGAPVAAAAAGAAGCVKGGGRAVARKAVQGRVALQAPVQERSLAEAIGFSFNLEGDEESARAAYRSRPNATPRVAAHLNRKLRTQLVARAVPLGGSCSASASLRVGDLCRLRKTGQSDEDASRFSGGKPVFSSDETALLREVKASLFPSLKRAIASCKAAAVAKASPQPPPPARPRANSRSSKSRSPSSPHSSSPKLSARSSRSSSPKAPSVKSNPKPDTKPKLPSKSNLRKPASRCLSPKPKVKHLAKSPSKTSISKSSPSTSPSAKTSPQKKSPSSASLGSPPLSPIFIPASPVPSATSGDASSPDPEQSTLPKDNEIRRPKSIKQSPRGRRLGSPMPTSPQSKRFPSQKSSLMNISPSRTFRASPNPSPLRKKGSLWKVNEAKSSHSSLNRRRETKARQSQSPPAPPSPTSPPLASPSRSSTGVAPRRSRTRAKPKADASAAFPKEARFVPRTKRPSLAPPCELKQCGEAEEVRASGGSRASLSPPEDQGRMRALAARLATSWSARRGKALRVARRRSESQLVFAARSETDKWLASRTGNRRQKADVKMVDLLLGDAKPDAEREPARPHLELRSTCVKGAAFGSALVRNGFARRSGSAHSQASQQRSLADNPLPKGGRPVERSRRSQAVRAARLAAGHSSVTRTPEGRRASLGPLRQLAPAPGAAPASDPAPDDPLLFAIGGRRAPARRPFHDPRTASLSMFEEYSRLLMSDTGGLRARESTGMQTLVAEASQATAASAASAASVPAAREAQTSPPTPGGAAVAASGGDRPLRARGRAVETAAQNTTPRGRGRGLRVREAATCATSPVTDPFASEHAFPSKENFAFDTILNMVMREVDDPLTTPSRFSGPNKTVPSESFFSRWMKFRRANKDSPGAFDSNQSSVSIKELPPTPRLASRGLREEGVASPTSAKRAPPKTPERKSAALGAGAEEAAAGLALGAGMGAAVLLPLHTAASGQHLMPLARPKALPVASPAAAEERVAKRSGATRGADACDAAPALALSEGSCLAATGRCRLTRPRLAPQLLARNTNKEAGIDKRILPTFNR